MISVLIRNFKRALRKIWFKPEALKSPLSRSKMSTTLLANVTLNPQANVYFDGKCVSHSFTLPDGTKKSAGVILPSSLVFNTGAAEIMECVAGSCEYKLAGSDAWVTSSAGEKFSVPANSKFDIRCTEPYHYICHFA